MASLVPNLAKRERQNFEVNFVSLSDTMIVGNPRSRTIPSKKRRAVSAAESSCLEGKKSVRLVNLSSAIITIFYWPSPDFSKGPAKSIVTVCHLPGGVGRGWCGPYDLLEGLLCRNVIQDRTYDIFGHVWPVESSANSVGGLCDSEVSEVTASWWSPMMVRPKV
jgi:hypothetical protein